MNNKTSTAEKSIQYIIICIYIYITQQLEIIKFHVNHSYRIIAIFDFYSKKQGKGKQIRSPIKSEQAFLLISF